ncbi:MAG: hypothetical protein NTZ74_11160 [Chloroflexi bacterium]|nr:hypothetical protein [Chloroflexota bacterium]
MKFKFFLTIIIAAFLIQGCVLTRESEVETEIETEEVFEEESEEESEPVSETETIETPAPTEEITTAPSSTVSYSCPSGDCITSCIADLSAKTGEWSANVDGTVDSTETFDAEGLPLVTYQVDGEKLTQPELNQDIPEWLIPYQEDIDFHTRLWGLFYSILPEQEKDVVTQFAVMTDGVDEILASAYQSDNAIDEWVLEVDILDTSNLSNLVLTIIHELGHLVTSNPTQVVLSEAIFNDPENDTIYEDEMNACDSFFPGEGCSLPDSYINLFYERFWMDINDEWTQVNEIEDQEELDQALNDLYQKYSDQFVSDYAITNPSEDIAESFTQFIGAPKPEGNTIAEEKILFFYEFPELVDLRAEISSSFCDYVNEE